MSLRNYSLGMASMPLTIGLIMVGLGASVFAIDIPYYFAAQNQLQTATDAAALAGASQLPDGNQQAEDAAYDVASENLIAGNELEVSDLDYEISEESFVVKGQKEIPTVMANFLCGMAGKNTSEAGELDEGQQGGSGTTSENENNPICRTMTVSAHSKAVPAARDTMLVIDTSSSMGDGTAVINPVRTSAQKFVDIIATLKNKNVDRVGLVKFDRTGSLQIGLTYKKDYSNTGFTKVKDKIKKLTLYSGSGWNTNYQAGLKLAVDELVAHGRPNATKNIIFLTDGAPNLPAPANYVSYDTYNPITKCTDLVDNSQAVRNLCYRRNGRTYCYYMPDSHITNTMIINAGGKSCAQTYTNYMISETQAQVTRAVNADITIHTIKIFDDNIDSSSTDLIRRLMTNSNWNSGLLEYFADTTDGHQYASENQDPAEINEIYETIANDVRMKLSN